MKKYLIRLCGLGLAAALMAGCAPAGEPMVTQLDHGATGDEATTQFIPITSQAVEATTEYDDNSIAELPFRAQYIRTNSCSEMVSFPDVKLIKSAEELEDYYEENREAFYLDAQWYSDGNGSFPDACAGYDEAFFQENYLLMVLLEEGSGSITHRVQQVTTASEDRISVSIDTIEPECGTCDMAQWHIILELSRDYEVEDQDHVMVFLDGGLAWHKEPISPPVSIDTTQLRSPPPAILHHSNGSEEIMPSGFSWFWDNPDGSSNAISADALHPLSCRESLSPIPVTTDYVKLEFEEVPNSITVRCWPDSAWGSCDSPSEAVPSHDLAFDVMPGGYIYEITATWNKAGASSYGTAHYYAYVIAYTSSR